MIPASTAPDAVVTIFRRDEIPLLAPVMAGLVREGFRPHLVALELDVYEILRSAGIACERIDGFTPAQDLDGIDERAIALAHTWYSCGGRDRTRLDGVSLGSLVSWECSYFFAEVLRCRIHARRLVTALRPARIVFLAPRRRSPRGILLAADENLHHDALRDECVPRRIPCEAQDEPAPGNGSADSVPVLSPTRPRACWRENWRADSGGPAGRRILTTGLSYLGPGLVDRLIASGAEILVVGRGSERSDTPRPARPVSLGDHDGPQVESLVARAAHRLAQRWLRHRNALLHAIEEREPGLGDMRSIAERLEHLFATRLPSTYRDLVRARRLISTERVGLVLLHDDVTACSKTLALAANGSGATSLVLLHGAVAHPIGALPLVAQKVAVYGTCFREWFVGRGVETERIEVTGSARLTEIDPSRRGALADALRVEVGVAPRHKVVVLALQHCNRPTWFANVHWPHEEWRRLADALVEAADRIGGIHVMLKLHPAADDVARWRRWHEGLRVASPVSLIHGRPLEPLLAGCDLLITGWSTLALEAALADVPVLVANFTGRPTPMDWGSSGLAASVRAAEELGPAVRALLFDEAIRQARLEQARRSLPPLLAHRGEASSARICALVRDLLVGAPAQNAMSSH